MIYNRRVYSGKITLFSLLRKAVYLGFVLAGERGAIFATKLTSSQTIAFSAFHGTSM